MEAQAFAKSIILFSTYMYDPSQILEVLLSTL